MVEHESVHHRERADSSGDEGQLSVAENQSHTVTESDEALEERRESYDILLMLLVPYVAFLIAESINLSGYIVLILSGFFLNLYGTPNMERDRADSLGNILQAMSYASKNLAYLCMGISFPLRITATDDPADHDHLEPF